MAGTVLTSRTLNRALLARQMLLARERISAETAIERLAGIQAQQVRPPFVALWSRLEGFGREHLLSLIRGRVAVRSVLMRATIHLVTARDFVALRGAIQPALTAAMQRAVGRHLDGVEMAEVVAVAREAFASGPRTFAELRRLLAARFPGSNERALGYAVRTQLALVLVPGQEEWGYRADADFALAGDWLGARASTTSETKLLLKRYLAAFGPASIADARAWSGLPGLQDAFAELRPDLQVFRDDAGRELFDIPESPRPPEDTPAPVRFLAEFDNAILGHASRTRIIADRHRPRVITRNLLVPGTVLVDGLVAATWKLRVGRKDAVLEVKPFGRLTAAEKSEIAEEGDRLAAFLAPVVERRRLEFSKT